MRITPLMQSMAPAFKAGLAMRPQGQNTHQVATMADRVTLRFGEGNDEGSTKKPRPFNEYGSTRDVDYYVDEHTPPGKVPVDHDLSEGSHQPDPYWDKPQDYPWPSTAAAPN